MLVKNVKTRIPNFFSLKELRNRISRIIRLWSLLCSIRVYASLHFLPILLENYNQFHTLRLFDVLPNFPFTRSETMGDYYL